MDISRLPRPGADFSLSDPEYGFKRRFNEITLKSKYKNIRDASDLIVGLIEEHEDIIHKGGLSYDLQLKIWHKIREADRNLTHDDMLKIKDILEYLGE